MKIVKEETISKILNFASSIIGERFSDRLVEIIPTKVIGEGVESIFKYANYFEKTLGKNKSFVLAKLVGGKLSRSIVKGIDDSIVYDDTLQEAINDLGLAEEVFKTDSGLLVYNCSFYDMLQKNGLDPIEHSICYACVGFNQEFNLDKEGNSKPLKWASRNISEKQCNLIYIK